MLMTAEVILSDQAGNSEIAHVLFDTGAQSSLANPYSFKRVQPTFIPLAKPKAIAGVCAGQVMELTHVAQFFISPKNHPNIKFPITASAVPQDLKWYARISKWKPSWVKTLRGQLADERIATRRTSLEFNIVLDIDYTRRLVPNLGNITWDHLFVDKTQWGIFVTGKYVTHDKVIPAVPERNMAVAVTFLEPELEEIIEAPEDWMTAWELAFQESRYDIFRECVNDLTPPAEEFVEKFWDTITFDDTGRPTVALPRNANFVGPLTTNARVGAQRAKRVLEMLRKGDARAQNYTEAVEFMIENFMEKVDYDKIVASGEPYAELPHHAVYRQGTSMDTRIVFDGSAKDPGTKSLNEFFYVGPNLLPRIQDILTRVRKYAAVAIADIKKAFMQVGVPPEDRNYLLFRWQRKDKNGRWRTHWFRFTRLPWGLVCSPFVLNAVIRFLFKRYAEKHPEHKEVLDAIAADTYVDDLAAGADTEDEAVRRMRIAMAALAEGKMILTKFKGVPATIGDRLAQADTPRQFKMLGMLVDADKDLIRPALKTIEVYCEATSYLKKHVAGMVNGVYDPVGLAAPATLVGKFRWQEFLETYPRVEWTFKLPQEAFTIWHNYCEETKKLTEYWLPRMIFPRYLEGHRFALFSDASREAIGAVVYVILHRDGKPFRSEILGGVSKTINKTRQYAHDKALAKWRDKHGKEYELAAPPINRLELGGAVMAVSLAVEVCKRLDANLEAFSCHTDSKNVLRMLATKAEGYSEADAVRRKVGHVLKHTALSVWFHVATEDNPADLVTKGMKPQELLHSDLWRHGSPNLLKDPYPVEQTTPIEDPLPLPSGVIVATTTAHDGKTRRKRKNNRPSSSHTNVRSGSGRSIPAAPGGLPRPPPIPLSDPLRPSVQDPEDPPLSLSPPTQTSGPCLSLTKPTWQESILAAEAHVHQHLPRIKTLLDQGARREAILGLLILAEAQEKCDPTLWLGLQAARLPANLKLKVENNHLEMQEHLGIKIIISVRRIRMDLKVRSETQVQLDEEKWIFRHYLPHNHLIYVPRSSPTARILAEWAHLNTAHGAVSPMEAFLGTQFWIPRATKLLKDVRRKCTNCKLVDAQVYDIEEAGLHSFRTTGQSAWEVIGIDFVGPFKILIEDQLIPPKKKRKRAVHPGEPMDEEEFFDTQEESYFSIPTHGYATRASLAACPGEDPEDPTQISPKRGPGRPPIPKFRAEFDPLILIIVDPYTRAISLQPARDTGAEASIRALNYFRFNRGARPEVVIHDNATGFMKHKHAEEIMGKVFQGKWRPNPARSPWWGGWYERLNALIKDKLARLFHSRKFTSYDEFVVAVSCLELIINNRPIYATKTKIRDSHFFIKPAQFVYPNHPDNIDRTIASIMAPLAIELEEPNELVQRLMEQKAFFKKLNEVFQDNYVADLNKWHKNQLFKQRHKGKQVDRFKVGDLVLIKPDKEFKRSPWHKIKWNIGEIVALHKNKYGTIRTVDVRQQEPGGKNYIKVRHGIQNFAPLEINKTLEEFMAEVRKPAVLPDGI